MCGGWLFANSSILSQLIDDHCWLIAFRSQSLSPEEKNYETYDEELLAIIEKGQSPIQSQTKCDSFDVKNKGTFDRGKLPAKM